MKTSTLRNAISIALFVAATGTTGLALADQAATDATAPYGPPMTAKTAIDVNLPAGTLAAALDALGAQSGLRLDYRPDVVAGRQAKAVRGRMSWREALDRLLRGSGLAYRRISGTTVVIEPAQERATRGQRAAASAATTSPAAPAVSDLAAITVTGTRIRGGTTPSPVITIGSEQIRQEGFADLGEVIRSVPQNFSGGQNPGVAAGAAAGGPSEQNVTGGSGLDLRGLGPDATLTLLNGRRMSYGGFSQAVDISGIPVEAVERMEIVPDGASAIYGSDAVGGVANVILKRDFEGVTVGARYGGATDGGLITHEYNATAGTTWVTGGLLVTGKKTSNDPIYSDQRDYTRAMYRPSTLWQNNDLRSGLLSLHQSVGDAAELHLDALSSKRDIETDMAFAGVYYPYRAQTHSTLVAPGLDLWLWGDWTLTLGAAVGDDKTSFAQPTVNSATRDVIADSHGAYGNKTRSYEVGAEGPVFTLPGGQARLATGAGYRYNHFLDESLSRHTITADGDQKSRFAYAELSLPLIGPEQGVCGADRLALTGAVRTEDGDYGTVTTPKLGVIYAPSADVSLKASWGKSFKAPTLLQRYSTQTAVNYTAATFGGAGYGSDATVLWLSGGNADLRPERAGTWSASLAFHPEALPDLETELTWFDIDYTQRILQPITTHDVLGNQVYADFVDYQPTAEAQTAALAGASNFYNYAGAPYDADKVVAIVDSRYVNASRERIQGIDLSGSYRFLLGVGHLTVRGSASWLDSTRALTTTQRPYDLAGTLFHPARTNARIGALWSEGGFSASLFGNYKSGVKDNTVGRKGASFATFDGTLRYDTGGRDGPLRDMTFELAVQNLLDRAPPLYGATSLTYAPYDSTNYSAVGRFVSLSVTKHW